MVQRKVTLDLSWRSLLKVLAVAAVVLILWQLSRVLMLLAVAVVLAVALDPVVEWLERRGLTRAWSASLVSGFVLVLAALFLWKTWASLGEQSEVLAEQLGQAQEQVMALLPQWMRDGLSASSGSVTQSLSAQALYVAQSASSAIAYVVLGFFVTFYLLLDGRRAYAWAVAFVPQRHRDKVERTALESKDAIYGYVLGNAITSVIAAVCTLIALSILDVPAALLLSILAGLSDFVPVIGFVVSAIPAIALALTVSGSTALIVVAFYVVYNVIENYVLSPWAYGNRMRLSDLAIILAFVIGAELAGVIGALIALPIAAMYPTIERIWLRQTLPEGTVAEHEALEQ